MLLKRVYAVQTSDTQQHRHCAQVAVYRRTAYFHHSCVLQHVHNAYAVMPTDLHCIHLVQLGLHTQHSPRSLSTVDMAKVSVQEDSVTWPSEVHAFRTVLQQSCYVRMHMDIAMLVPVYRKTALQGFHRRA